MDVLNKSLGLLLSAGLCVVVPCAAAQASTIEYTGLGLHDIVTIHEDVTGTPGRTESVYAGELDWELLDPGSSAVAFYTYCVDVADELQSTQTVTLEPSDLLSTGATDAGGKAAWLVNTFAPGIHDSGSGLDAAALQVAIWEAIYDDSPDLGAGHFQVLTDSRAYTGSATALAITSQADVYLGELFDGNGYHTSNGVYYDAVRGQDQMPPVPEPAPLILLATGLAGLVYYERRRRGWRRASAGCWR